VVDRYADHPNNTPEKRRARAAHAGRAPKLRQRGAQLQERDNLAFLDLFFLDWMETDQLHRLHYYDASRQRAYNRLNQLLSDGYLKSVVLRTKVLAKAMADVEGDEGAARPKPRLVRRAFFALTPKTRGAVAATLAREGLSREELFASGFENPGRNNPELSGLADLSEWIAGHQRTVVDLYASVKPFVEERLGPQGLRRWFWRNERRSYRSYRAGGAHAFNPDAELVVALPLPPGAPPDERPETVHLFVEVQTAASNKSAAEIARKVAGYARAAGGKNFPKRRALLFATETLAHEQAVVAACSRFGITNYAAGAADSVARLLVGYAKNPAALPPEAATEPSANGCGQPSP